MNLLTAPWIPVSRKSGADDNIRPLDLIRDQHNEDPIVRVRMPFSELEMAVGHFLIALFTTFLPPATPRQMARWIAKGVQGVDLDAIERDYPHLFQFTGGEEDSLFMQPLFGLPKDEKNKGLPIQRIAMFSLTENKLSTGAPQVFSKDNPGFGVGLPVAAAMVIHFQMYAARGGNGYSSSMRGAGARSGNVTVLATSDTLLRSTLLNVRPLSERTAPEGERPVFWSWESQHRDAGKVLPQEWDPNSVLWEAPRRIRLDNPVLGRCALTGIGGPVICAYSRNNAPLGFPGWATDLVPEGVKTEPVYAETWGSIRKNSPVLSRLVNLSDEWDGMGLTEFPETRMQAYGVFKDGNTEAWVCETRPLYMVSDPEHAERIASLVDIMVCHLSDKASGIQKAVGSATNYAKWRKKSVWGAANKRGFYACVDEDFHKLLRKAQDPDFDQDCITQEWGKILAREMGVQYDNFLRALRVSNPGAFYTARTEIYRTGKSKGAARTDPKKEPAMKIEETPTPQNPLTAALASWARGLQVDNGARARLRRCFDLTAIRCTGEYITLYNKMPDTDCLGTWLPLAVALIAHAPATRYGKQAGGLFGQQNTRLSEARFRKVLGRTSPDDLFQEIRPTLPFVAENVLDIGDLVVALKRRPEDRDIYWATQYYTANPYKPKDP